MKILSIALIGILIPAFASSDEPSRPSTPTIRVSGSAIVNVAPDQAQIDLGVVTQAPTAPVAGTKNAQKLDTVVSAVRRVLGSGAEIKTVGYSLSPEYRYPKEGGQPTITGYTASNVVQVRVNDLTKVGTVIDSGLAAGANSVHSLQFRLKDETATELQALREAAVRAKAKGDVLASALGTRIVRVLHVDEGAPSVILPPREMDMMMRAQAASAPPTPIEPGTVAAQATVTLTLEIAP